MATQCRTVPLTDSLVLVGRTKDGGQYVEIDPASIPNVNEADVCECLEDCEKIKAMDAKDVNLQNQINDLNKQTDELRDKDTDLQNQIDEINDKDDSQDQLIDQVNTEISGLKTDYINVLNRLKALGIHVILDPTYTTFEDWVNNVYIPGCGTSSNEYTEGDWYINTNPALDASQSVYVNIRKPDSTAPCSINDWYKLPYDIPALAIIGIDPIFVRHPYRGRFEVGIDPDKLADFIANLDKLDLSSVKLYLGDVYLDWVIKESLTIEENLEVGDKITTEKLEVKEDATIKELTVETGHIETHVGDEDYLGNINVTGDVNAINGHYDGNVDIDGNLNVDGHTETDTIHAREGCIEKFTCPPEFDNGLTSGDTIINNENITVNKVVTNNIINEGDTHLEGPVTIVTNTFNLEDPETHEIICLQNVAKNLSRPSYGFFTFSGGGTFSNPGYSTAVIGLGGNGIAYFNAKQNEGLSPAQQCAYVDFNTGEGTHVEWDIFNQTPGVGMNETSNGAHQIFIYGSDPENAGIYRISFHLTVGFQDLNSSNPWDFYAHRAGVCLYNMDNINDHIIFDDKHASGRDIWEYQHNHTYDDMNNGEDSSGNRYDVLTSTNTMKSYTTVGGKEAGYVNRQIVRSDDHYTYEVNIDYPITTDYYVAPYLKVSTGYSGLFPQGKFTITDGQWVSGGVSRLSIVKVANIGTPYEYHCEG